MDDIVDPVRPDRASPGLPIGPWFGVLPAWMTHGGCRDAPPSVAGSVRSPATGTSDRESVPRMAGMPATMDGARFVGRDAAFIRLAPALEEAAGGEATAVLLDGPGGVGVSRFVGEVARRVGGLTEPFTVVRGRSYRPGADEAYGPIVRALRPIFRDVDGRRAGAARRAGPRGRRPALPRDPGAARPRRGPPRAADDHRPGAAPGPRARSPARGRRAAERGPAGAPRPRGPP